MTRSAIVAREMSFRYPDSGELALKDANLDISGAGITALTGPSGSGKSTLLQCLAGLRTVTSGQVHVLGVDITAMRDPGLTVFRRERIGFVLQSPGLLPEMSGLDNVRSPGGCRRCAIGVRYEQHEPSWTGLASATSPNDSRGRCPVARPNASPWPER